MVRITAWHVHGLPAIHLSKRDWSTKATLSSLHETRLKVSSVILATLFMDVVVLESHNHLCVQYLLVRELPAKRRPISICALEAHISHLQCMDMAA